MLSRPEQVMDSAIRMALIDPYQLSRECLTAAFGHGASPLAVTAFESPTDLLASATPDDFDLLVINAHGRVYQLPEDVSVLRIAAFIQPIVMVSAGSAPAEMAVLATALRQGASGHLPMQSTSIDMAISSFVFAREGGTFAPMALLLEEPPAPEPRPRERRPRLRKSPPREAVAVMEADTDDEHV